MLLKVALFSSLDRERCLWGGGTWGDYLESKTLRKKKHSSLIMKTGSSWGHLLRLHARTEATVVLPVRKNKKTRLASGSRCRRCKSNIQQRVTRENEKTRHIFRSSTYLASVTRIFSDYTIALVFTYSFHNFFSRVSFCHRTPQTHSPVPRSQVGVQGRSNNYVRQELWLLHHWFP